MLINGHEYLVEESLEIVPLHPIHDEPLEGGHHNDVRVSYWYVEVEKPSVVQFCACALYFVCVCACVCVCVCACVCVLSRGGSLIVY